MSGQLDLLERIHALKTEILSRSLAEENASSKSTKKNENHRECRLLIDTDTYLEESSSKVSGDGLDSGGCCSSHTPNGEAHNSFKKLSRKCARERSDKNINIEVSPEIPLTISLTGCRLSLRRNIQKPKWLADPLIVTDYKVVQGKKSMRTRLNPITSKIVTTGSRRDIKQIKMKGSEDLKTSDLPAANVSISPQLNSEGSINVTIPEIPPTINDVINAGPFVHVQSVSLDDICTGKASASEITKPTTLSSTHVSPDSNGNDGKDFHLNNEAESELMATGEDEGVTFGGRRRNTVSEKKSGEKEQAISSALTTEESDNGETGDIEKEDLHKFKSDESEKEEMDNVETGESEEHELPKDETRESETYSNFTSNKEEENSQPPLPPTNSAHEEDMYVLTTEPVMNAALLASVSSSLTQRSKDNHEENVSNNSNSLAAVVPVPVLYKDDITKVITDTEVSSSVVENESHVHTESMDSFMSEFSEYVTQVSENIDDEGVKLKDDCLRYIAKKVSSNSIWTIRKELKRLKKDKRYFKFAKICPLAADLMYELFCERLT